jgi:hypothetical protein
MLVAQVDHGAPAKSITKSQPIDFVGMLNRSAL